MSVDGVAEYLCPMCPAGHLVREVFALRPDAYRCDRCRAFFRGLIPDSWRWSITNQT